MLDLKTLERFIKGNRERRSSFLNHMEDNLKKEISCANCVGVCCTFVYNSMKVTPVEAFDILYFLINENINLAELEKKLDEVIKHYRLNNGLGNGKKDYIRRTYTCPFFKGTKLGCSIDKEFRPYGCLGFNPKSKNISNGENCGIIDSLYEEKEKNLDKDFYEQNLDEKIKDHFQLNFQKEYLPVALKEIIQLLK